MTKLRNLLLLLALLAAPALVSAQPSMQMALPAKKMATPSLWHVTGDPAKGESGEAYLLGSVHILPANMEWRTPAIRRGITRADVFVFEVPTDAQSVARLQGMIQQRGFLAPGESLRGMLTPKARIDYDAAVAESGLNPAELDRQRPWLAGLQLMFAQLRKLRYDADQGVDSVLVANAMRDKKEVRYLETIEEQFALLAPEDRKLEMDEFEAGLKDIRDVASEMGPLVQAWSSGNQKELDRLINGQLDDFPRARKELLDDRNAGWLPRVRAMLKEKQVFFITVGAGHLTGPKGVPALLRKAGYKVEGP